MTGSSDYVLVCGGSGFIGAHLVSHLVRAPGPWRAVKALARSKASADKVRSLGAEPVLGDMLDEDGAFREAAAGAAYVVSAAQPPVGPDYALRTKMEDNLLRALDAAKLKRAVLIFGSSYYGRTEAGEVADETMSPRRPVGLGPLFAPSIEALDTFRGRGIDVVGAFPGGVYGRGARLLELYLGALQIGKPIIVPDPPPCWPYIQIEDCARALEFLLTVDAARLDAAGRDIILADDEPTCMVRFITAVAEAVGKPAELRFRPGAVLQKRLPPLVVEYLTANMVHSNARLRRLGFELLYPRIAQGIQALALPRLGAPSSL
jgi:nucleoside-diphosphate-sugar epimerase